MSKKKQNIGFDVLPLFGKASKKDKQTFQHPSTNNINSPQDSLRKVSQQSNNQKRIRKPPNPSTPNQLLIPYDTTNTSSPTQTQYIDSSSPSSQSNKKKATTNQPPNIPPSRNKSKRKQWNDEKHQARQRNQENVGNDQDIMRCRQFSRKQINQLNDQLTEQQAIQKAIRQSLKDRSQERKLLQTTSLQNYNHSNHKKNQTKTKSNSSIKQNHPHNHSKNKQKKQKVGPFSNLYIVLTGQFQPYSKSQLLQLLQKLGANLPKSITKKTTHLLQGSYVVNQYQKKTDQDVRTTTKSLQAMQKGVKIVGFEKLDQFFRIVGGKSLEEFMEQQRNNKKYQQNMYIYGTAKSADNPTTSPKHLPWTQKYHPKTSQQILGQSSQIRDLLNWLHLWQDIHITGNKLQTKSTTSYYNSFMPSGTINSNAALLSGDPGLGKTTTARLVAVQLGYSLVQYNASDVRNKKVIQQIAKNNLSFSNNNCNKQMKKTLIVMDQVDGMSSGDHGGISAIIQMIKKTKIPIICICNDRQSPKIRSLATYCYDIKFHKTNRNIIVKTLQQIIEIEGGKCTNKSLECFVEIMQNDIRQILNYLEMIFRSGIKNIDIDFIQKCGKQPKDYSIMLNFFQSSKNLMNRTTFSSMSIPQRIDLAFVDSDLIPLTVLENYLIAAPKKKMNSKQFRRVVKATTGLVMGDLVERVIVKNQNYCLMPNRMFLGCVYPCEMVCQNLGYPKFPQWFGKYSTQRKNRRFIKQLKNSLSCTSTITTNSTKHNFAPTLLTKIHHTLKLANPPYDQLVHFMLHYRITPSTISQHLTNLQHASMQTLFKNLQQTKKTKLTKTYNKLSEENKLKPKNNAKTHIQQHAKFDPVLGEVSEGEDDSYSEQSPSGEEEVKQEIIRNKKGKKSAKGKKGQ